MRANLAFAVLFYASVKSKVSLPILARLGRKCDNSGCLADYFVRRKLFSCVSVNTSTLVIGLNSFKESLSWERGCPYPHRRASGENLTHKSRLLAQTGGCGHPRSQLLFCLVTLNLKI
ncbi:MAG TPA: hypothetical protein VF644_10925 [Pyrinomonadaceae bacterium]|jgi:hypothetical protein